MKRTLMIAAALLSLGIGSAFAGDGDPHAQPPAMANAATYAAGAQSHRLFSAATHNQVSLYSSFGGDQYSRGQE
jgi:hypothetical protein